MHAMFVELFIDPDTDELRFDDQRGRVRRAQRRRAQQVMTVRTGGRDAGRRY